MAHYSTVLHFTIAKAQNTQYSIVLHDTNYLLMTKQIRTKYLFHVTLREIDMVMDVAKFMYFV